MPYGFGIFALFVDIRTLWIDTLSWEDISLVFIANWFFFLTCLVDRK